MTYRTLHRFSSSVSAAALALLAIAPAKARPQSAVDVSRYEATIHFDIADRTISGDARITLRNATTEPLSAVTLHLRDLSVARSEQESTPVNFTQGDGELVIQLSSPLPAGAETHLRILYGGAPTAEPPPSSWGGFFSGGKDGVTFSMGVSFGTSYVSMTRHWLPSNDVPSDKALFDLTYIVPNGYAAAGTGTLQSTAPAGSDSVAYRWVESHPTATYLVTVAIARYALVQDTWNGIPCSYYVLQKDSVKATTFFTPVRGMMDAFSAVFGPYPFDKIGYCMTPIGAMEHQTMISYPQQLLDFYPQAETVAAHELAHMWWGDNVTPKDFREAWLSEGFASYAEAIYAEHLRPGTGYLTAVRGFINSYLNSTVRSEGIFALYDFPRTPPSSNYPGTIYKKGASVLAMLRHVTGDTAFFSGLREYGGAHAYGSATTEDFRAAMEGAWGADLDWFFREWVYQAGYPEYVLQSSSGLGNEPLRIRVLQTQDTLKYPLFTMPIDIGIVRKTGDTLFFTVTNHALRTEEFTFASVPVGSVMKVLFDPPGILLKKVTYQTLAVPRDRNERTFELIGTFPNPVRPGVPGAEEAEIRFRLARPMEISLDLFDSLGRKIAGLLAGRMEPGQHAVRLPVAAYRSGLYFTVLRSGSESAVSRVIIQR